jgi:abequosyltransferase
MFGIEDLSKRVGAEREPRSHLRNERNPDITKPLLTIAIPTYNRAWCLRELLPVIFDQAKDESRIELIISDNASPDETPSVVQDFVARGLPVRYIRNTQNIGPDANFLQCFEQARGKYVWLFSDDDLIIPGALRKILAYCEAAEYDLIWVSGYSFAESHQHRTAGPNGYIFFLLSSRETSLTKTEC